MSKPAEEKDVLITGETRDGENCVRISEKRAAILEGRSLYSSGELDDPRWIDIFDKAIEEYRRKILEPVSEEESLQSKIKEQKENFMKFFWKENRDYTLFANNEEKESYLWHSFIKRDRVDDFKLRYAELFEYLQKKEEKGIAFDGEEEVMNAYFEMLEIMDLEQRGYGIIKHLQKENREGLLNIFRTIMKQRMGDNRGYESSDFEREFLKKIKFEEEVRGNKDWIEACGENFHRWLEEEAKSIMKELLDENPESIDYNLNYPGSFYYKFFKEKGHPDLSNLNAKYRKFLERAAALRASGANAETEVKNVYAYFVLIEDLKKIWLKSPTGIGVDEEVMKKLYEKYLYLKKLGIPFEKRSNLEKIFDHMMKSYGASLSKSN